MRPVPVIDVTDLYHPHQDPGDNFDIITPYALSEIDLRAVILDATDEYRRAYADHPDPYMRDDTGPREPGVIPMMQMNWLFDANVPFAQGPFLRMKSPDDKQDWLPKFQQAGIELLLKTLRDSEEKVHILSFGSTRSIAAAYNRDPELMRQKVAMVHLCAGAVPDGFLEWNVQLDQNAFVCLLRSDLPKVIYPCATQTGPWSLGSHNTYWKLENLSFIKEMHPRLKRYLAYVFHREMRADFLTALENDLPEEDYEDIYSRVHSVWETAVWLCVSGRKLVKTADGCYRIKSSDEVSSKDVVLKNDLVPIRLTNVMDNGDFKFEYSDEPTDCLLYDRGDAELNQVALQQALGELYKSYTCRV